MTVAKAPRVFQTQYYESADSLALCESIKYIHSHSAASHLVLFHIRYFLLVGSWSVYTDPHRSLIGFKAIVLSAHDSA